jgi:hypothetical protein
VRLQRLAIVGLGVVIFAYLGLLIYSVAFGSDSSTDHSLAESETAQLVGESALRQLSNDWSETALKQVVDSRMHEQTWFKDVTDKLPIFREDLGALVTIVSHAVPSEKAPGSKVQLFTYTANSQHTKGSAYSKLLLYWDSNRWGVLILDVKVETTNSKSNIEPSGT